MTQLISDKAFYDFVKRMSGATIHDVCTNFDVSESTARRTMSRLEKKGWLRRFRGGAVALPLPLGTTAYDQRLKEHYQVKEAIASKATEYIEEGTSIILLGGTTVSGLCSGLHGKELNVITNSLTVIDQLKGTPGIKLIMLGGAYNHDEYEFVGNMTTNGLRIMQADSLFMSCVGFSPDVGFMTDQIDSVEFYRLCMKNTGKTYMLADSTKLTRKGIAVFAQTQEIDCLISDGGLPSEAVNLFIEKQVQVDLVL